MTQFEFLKPPAEQQAPLTMIEKMDVSATFQGLVVDTVIQNKQRVEIEPGQGGESMLDLLKFNPRKVGPKRAITGRIVRIPDGRGNP